MHEVNSLTVTFTEDKPFSTTQMLRNWVMPSSSLSDPYLRISDIEDRKLQQTLVTAFKEKGINAASVRFFPQAIELEFLAEDPDTVVAEIIFRYTD